MSEVAICNAALIKLGAATITALAQDTNNARVMNERYAAVRDAELQRRRWKFSITRASLPALAAAPDSDYARQFQLPVDYLRLIEGGGIIDVPDLSNFRSGRFDLYSVEGQRLLTNLGAPLAIRYLARVTDTALFNASFAESLAARLALDTCYRITQSTDFKESCREDYKQAIREAVRANALEAPPRQQADAEWVMARAL